MARYVVDYLRSTDLDAVHEIDLASFPAPWQRTTYENELRAGHDRRYVAARFFVLPEHAPAMPTPPQTSSSLRQRVVALTKATRRSLVTPAVPAGPLVGHAGICREGKTGHIATLAVHPAHRGNGVATLLLLALIEEARSLSVHRVALEVRASNTPAQHLYRSFGFRTVGTHSAYYTDNDEDAILLAIDDIGALEVREQHKRISDALFVRLQA